MPNHVRRDRRSGDESLSDDAEDRARWLGATRRSLVVWPVPLRWGAIGAVSTGVVGSVTGLVVGLVTYPRTAWFAIFELGAPSAIVGGLIGLASGVIASAVRRS